MPSAMALAISWWKECPASGGVVGFNVHLDLIFQTKLLQETIHRRDIVIVLMLGGLLRFRLDKQRAAKANLMLVLHHHLQEAANLLTLPGAGRYSAGTRNLRGRPTEHSFRRRAGG